MTIPNPCKCIDCGGLEPSHSTDCTYMAETFGEDCIIDESTIWPGAMHNAEIKGDVVYVAGTMGALDEGYNSNPPKEWSMDWLDWKKAITSNNGLTKRQQAILRHPQTHATDPIVAITLIQRGLLDVRKRWRFFGQQVVVLTRAGKKAQKALPPECYRSDPGPQAQAENDCFSCRHRVACVSFDMMETA